MNTNTPLMGNNIPELSVSDLAGAIKRSLEAGFARVRVRGELSRVSIPASGHLYTALKDVGAVIDAVCWRTQLPRLGVRPEEGLEVICTGRLTTYPARSNYQLIIEHMELAGAGALLKMIEDRRIKLAAEGLFDASRKRALPFLPRVMGVITSPTGAVIRDILHRLADRCPVRVIVWPVSVQGENAAAEVTRAIRGFNALPAGGDIPRPDILIVARGGGSIEDLMPFNDEGVVRAAATSAIPLISAVGHETDTTLIDYAADRRAPTPSAAAEFAVPVRDDLIAGLGDLGLRLTRAITRARADWAGQVGQLAARLGSIDRVLEGPRQRLDYIEAMLIGRMAQRHEGRAAKIARLAAGLRTPTQILTLAQHRFGRTAEGLARIQGDRLKLAQTRLDQVARLLESLSYTQTLARGFAVVRAENGDLVRAHTQIPPGTEITITLGDQVPVAATTRSR